MGVDEGNLQVMHVEMIIENFPIHTYGTYILTSSSNSICNTSMMFKEKYGRIWTFWASPS